MGKKKAASVQACVLGSWNDVFCYTRALCACRVRACVHACMHVCVSCACVRTCMCACRVRVCVHACVRVVCVRACMCARLFVRARVRECVRSVSFPTSFYFPLTRFSRYRFTMLAGRVWCATGLVLSLASISGYDFIFCCFLFFFFFFFYFSFHKYLFFYVFLFLH